MYLYSALLAISYLLKGKIIQLTSYLSHCKDSGWNNDVKEHDDEALSQQEVEIMSISEEKMEIIAN